MAEVTSKCFDFASSVRYTESTLSVDNNKLNVRRNIALDAVLPLGSSVVVLISRTGIDVGVDRVDCIST